MTKGKNLPLESLRGVAALAVALHHFRTGSPLRENVVIENAYMAVDLFFVLSGFVISLNYRDRITGWAAACKYQIRRFWRLYPLHVATLLIWVGIEASKYVFIAKTGIASRIPPFAGNDLKAFLANATLIHAFIMDRLTFNFPSWSISVEFVTYMVFAGVVLFARRRLALLATLIVAGSVFLLWFSGAGLHATDRFAFVRCLYSFFLGVLVCELDQSRRPEFSGLAILAIAVGTLALLVAAAGSPSEPLVALAFAALVLVLAGATPGGRTARIMSHPALVYLGTISYSIYLLHAALWFVIDQSLRFLLKLPTTVDSHGTTRVALGPTGATVLTVIGLLLLIGLSHLSYRHIEERFRGGWPISGRRKRHAPE